MVFFIIDVQFRVRLEDSYLCLLFNVFQNGNCIQIIFFIDLVFKEFFLGLSNDGGYLKRGIYEGRYNQEVLRQLGRFLSFIYIGKDFLEQNVMYVVFFFLIGRVDRNWLGNSL